MAVRPLRQNLLALLAYAALVLGILGPLHPTLEVWGNDTTDVYNHLHTRLWQATEAGRGRPFPTHDALVLYPDGGDLFIADSVASTLDVPVVWAAGPTFAYNLRILVSLLFGCWGLFWLVVRLTKDVPAAFLAGAIYGLSPLTLGHVNNGVIETLETGWLPLWLGLLLALVEDARRPGPGRRTAALALTCAGVWVAASLASHWYHGMYLGLLFGLVILAASLEPHRRGVWLRAGGVLVAFGLAILPFALYYLRHVGRPDSLSRELVTQNVLDPRHAADLLSFFAPRPPTGTREAIYLHLTYLGFTVPLLAAVGLFRSERRRQTAAWLLGALFFVVLALGPELAVGGERVTVFGSAVRLPYALLSRAVPFFSSMDFPYRLFLGVHLCLGLAVGLGASGLLKGRPLRAALYGAFCSAVLLEQGLLSGVPHPFPRQDTRPRGPLEPLDALPSKTVVFDLPIRFTLPALNRYVTNQLHHRRPIVYCNFPTATLPFSKTLARQSLATSLLALAGNPSGVPDRVLFFDESYLEVMRELAPARQLLPCLLAKRGCDPVLLGRLEADLRWLHSIGVTRFALHDDLVIEGAVLDRLCPILFGPPVAKRGRVTLFALQGARSFSR